MISNLHSLAVGVGTTALLHPFIYPNMLIQLGHEPQPPVWRRNIFFRIFFHSSLFRPGVFQYMRHIQKHDGYIGLCRGVMPRIFTNVTGVLTSAYVSNAICLHATCQDSYKNPVDVILVISKTMKEMAARCTAVIVSQPFHVIAVRTMAQFIGHESTYSNMGSSVVEIYREEGILGFFAGLIPRLASEVIAVCLGNLLNYAVNLYLPPDIRELGAQQTRIVIGQFVQFVTCPFSITGTIMAVNGARIKAGCLPFTPVYSNWVECLRDLRLKGLSRRGASMIARNVVNYVADPVPSSLPDHTLL